MSRFNSGHPPPAYEETLAFIYVHSNRSVVLNSLQMFLLEMVYVFLAPGWVQNHDEPSNVFHRLPHLSCPAPHYWDYAKYQREGESLSCLEDRDRYRRWGDFAALFSKWNFILPWLKWLRPLCRTTEILISTASNKSLSFVSYLRKKTSINIQNSLITKRALCRGGGFKLTLAPKENYFPALLISSLILVSNTKLSATFVSLFVW